MKMPRTKTVPNAANEKLTLILATNLVYVRYGVVVIVAINRNASIVCIV